MDEPGETSTTPKYEFKYDARGIASVIKDNVLMTETRVTSDLADRPSESVMRDASGNLLHKNVLNYDGKNRVKEFIDILPEATHKAAYTYDADNRVTEVKFDDSDTHKVNYTYDLLNRITNKTVTNGIPYSTTYGYLDGDVATYGEGATTPLIETITQGSGANAMNFAYAYDSRGNIVSETRNGVTVSYEYDELGQLTRVNDPNDTTAGTGGTTWVYTYDRGGNILRKDAYSYTTGSVSGNGSLYWNYGYDTEWKDQLKTVTKYNQSNVALIDNSNAVFTYDAIGNPLSDGTWTYTWEKGHQLKSMHDVNTGITLEYKYNQNGIRTQRIKKINDVVYETTDFILDGKRVIALQSDDTTIYFIYDSISNLVGFNTNGNSYSYLKNLQGDIVGILNSNNELVAEYWYDAWGKPVNIVATGESYAIATLNPFRYRSYIWDNEEKEYYLRYRCYNPQFSRFINSDAIIKGGSGILAYNSYAYCGNNVICKHDPYGLGWAEIWQSTKQYIREGLHWGNEMLVNLKVDTASIGAALLMFDESSEGIYHARTDCWQQFFGYNDLYDVGFDIGTLMQRKKTSFTHGGLQYTFWAWKGDYINLGAGAELGIYVGSGVHKQAATSMSMPMTISLTYENQEIINYSMNTWWMTGFNSEYRNVRPEDLSVVFTVDFSKNTEMFSSFYTQNQETEGWSFNKETYTASFSF